MKARNQEFRVLIPQKERNMLLKLKREGRKKNSPDRRGASCDNAGEELSRPWD
jgi:hypothetical protein